MDARCSVFGALPAGHVSSLRPTPFRSYSPLCVNYHCNSGVMATMRPVGSFFSTSVRLIECRQHSTEGCRCERERGREKKHVTQDSPFHITFLSACVCVLVFFFFFFSPLHLRCAAPGREKKKKTCAGIHSDCAHVLYRPNHESRPSKVDRVPTGLPSFARQ